VAKAAREHQPGSTGNFDMNAQQFQYCFWVTAAKPALSSNRECFRMPFGCHKPLARTGSAIGEVNQTKAEFSLRVESQAREGLEIAIITAISRHRHMDQVNAALDIRAKAVCEVDHIAHIGRFNDVPVVGVAVTEVEKKFDIRRHAIGKVRKNRRK